MVRYTAQRLMVGLVTAFLASLILFTILRIAPEDIAWNNVMGAHCPESPDPFGCERMLDNIRQRLRLYDPLFIQYLHWIVDWGTGNWGESLFSKEEIWENLTRKLPTTLQLVAMAQAIAALIGIPAGVFMAMRRNSWIDYFGKNISKVWLSIPAFFTAMLLIVGGIYFFAWHPPIGYIPPLEDPSGSFFMFLPPALFLGLPVSGTIALMIRSSTERPFSQEDYVETTPASGLSRLTLVIWQTLKTATVPAIVIVGLTFPAIAAGTLIMERIFFLDGMGNMLVEAMNQIDYPVIESLALFFCVWVIAVNTLVDILCGWLDPNVRFTRKSPREEWNYLANPVRLV